MAISVSGIGSGLDIDGLVTQLMGLERRPLTALAQREAGVQAKISAFGSMASAVSNLQTAANALSSTAKFAVTKATPGINAGFTATSTTKATAGTYAIAVNQLAQSQRVALSDNAFTRDGDDIAAGTLTLGFGTVAELSGNTPALTTTLQFTGGSIQDLRDAINAADLGIAATVINDGDADRLILSGADTGAAKGFSVQGLGIDFSPDAPGTDTDPVYQLQAAQNARITVDGLSITRENNVIDNVIEGVTLTLTTGSEAASSLKVTTDFTSARASIDGFVSAYNAVVTGLTNLTRYDAETREASLLTGDSTARAVQTQLRKIVGGVFEGLGGTERLPELGIRFGLDGTLSIDNDELTAALEDPERNVAAFFAGSGETKGFGARVADALGNLIGTGGLITGRAEGLKASATSLQNRTEALNRRLEGIEQRFRAQFTALDVLISNLTQTSAALEQQLANLPGVRRNN